MVNLKESVAAFIELYKKIVAVSKIVAVYIVYGY